MTEDSDSNRLPPQTGIGRAALRVPELAEPIRFYESVVGLEILDRNGERATLGVDGDQLLVLEAERDAPARGRTETGLFHTAFRVPSRGALGDALGRIRDRWQLDGASYHGVSEALYLSDPDGNGVEIYRDFPRQEWPRTPDGLVQMTTQRLDLEAVASAGSGAADAPAGTDVGHVHLEVSSLDGFRQFYVDVLGFDVEARMPDALFVGAGGYHHHLGANTWNSRSAPSQGRGLAGFEIVVPHPGALAAVRERLRVTDVAIRETDDGIQVADPDGIDVRLRSA